MFEKMKTLAFSYHAGQLRRGPGKIPYTRHLQLVVLYLLDWGEPETSPALCMAWGHDLQEDTTIDPAQILASTNQQIMDGILLLTRPRSMDKEFYYKRIANSNNREVIIVKIADIIQNTCDFVKLKGPDFAFHYPQKAKCVFEALKRLPADEVTKNAQIEWNRLHEELQEMVRNKR